MGSMRLFLIDQKKFYFFFERPEDLLKRLK